MNTLIFDVAWQSLLDWLHVSEEDARLLRIEVMDRYSEAGRAYHNLGHALRVLQDAKRLAHRFGVDDYGAVQWAALLHDVVYDTRGRDNEAESAEFAVRWGRALGVLPETCTRAGEIIRATQTHALPVGLPDAALVLDADLAILASPPDDYEAYRKAIRREYAWVPEADWVTGRRRVLLSFLEREQIYFLPQVRDYREAAARANIARELTGLGEDRVS